jgi:predicted transposase YdaD
LRNPISLLAIALSISLIYQEIKAEGKEEGLQQGMQRGEALLDFESKSDLLNWLGRTLI